MKIKKIVIENYRCFKHYEISFAPNVTVLIGKNGAGKTSIINAVKTALSFIFTDMTLNAPVLASGSELDIIPFEYGDYYVDKSTRMVADIVTIEAKAYFQDGEELHWHLYHRGKEEIRNLEQLFEPYNVFWNESLKTKLWPVYGYYSDIFPYVDNVKTSKYASYSLSRDFLQRNFGYYQWDSDTGDRLVWETQFLNSWNGKTANANAGGDYGIDKQAVEVDFVENRLKSFAEAIDDDAYKIKSLHPKTNGPGAIPYLVIEFVDGRMNSFESLPAGYRRLFSIVFDLAYRAYVLNETAEPQGIVMIDEVDLHLHPSLEQKVVQCFTKTFPEIQFIMTTHSPLVVTRLNTSLKSKDGIRKNSILYIHNEEQQADELFDVYGLDYNTGLSDAMGTEVREPAVTNLIDLYLIYKSQGVADKADEVYKKLHARVGDTMPRIDREIEERLKEMEV